MPSKPTSRTSASRRAQLRPTPRHDVQRAQVHDFRNLLTDLIWAAGLGQAEDVNKYSAQVCERYREAVSQ